MTHPYQDLPERHFWRTAVADPAADDVDPVWDVPFTLGRTDRVAAAGSCFAQHISRFLVQEGYNYLVTEATADGGHPAFPARFGNLYTVRQLLQLFHRAHGTFRPSVRAWPVGDRFIDPFRPQIPKEGFVSEAALLDEADRHLAAVREMFKKADVFIFTLGLTETWENMDDGAVVPVAPGVVGATASDNYRFRNLTVPEMEADLAAFVTALRLVNPRVRLILTVSPVPLVASYAGHVLTATTYSKSALRVVCETARRQIANLAYFPSYEIITGVHNKGRFFEENLRSVSADGVAHVMATFQKHFLGAASGEAESTPAAPPAARHAVDNPDAGDVICDEELLDA
ncbi:MAG: GSCFA domain-containing protein [Magnetospiraceae bacterium]